MPVSHVRWGIVVVASAMVVMARHGVQPTQATAIQCPGDEELWRTVNDSDGCTAAHSIDDVEDMVEGCNVKIFQPRRVYCIEEGKCDSTFNTTLYYNSTEGCVEAHKIKNNPIYFNTYFFFGKFLSNTPTRMSLQKILKAAHEWTIEKIINLFVCGNTPSPLSHQLACTRFPSLSLLGWPLRAAQHSESRALFSVQSKCINLLAIENQRLHSA